MLHIRMRNRTNVDNVLEKKKLKEKERFLKMGIS